MQKLSNHSCHFSAAHLLVFPDKEEGRTTWSSPPAQRILLKYHLQENWEKTRCSSELFFLGNLNIQYSLQ